jgi:hypothetical protein
MTLSHSDAGRLFLVESVPKFTKDASAPMLRLFTQVSGSTERLSPEGCTVRAVWPGFMW